MAPNNVLATTFPALLAQVRAAVDDRLAALWDAEILSLRRYGSDVVAAADAARDLTMRGGKRYRAALLVAAYAGVAPEAPIEPAYQAGIALELLQSYLLMQDDWMDGDRTRRGGPAVHAALEARMGDAHRGASFAILTSDYTWGLSLRTLSDIALPASRVLATVQTFSRLHADVVVGQQLDMLGNAPDVDVVHDLKTGAYTVRGPLVLGATLAGADATTLEALDRFAKPVGVAFQLRDDLLGTFGTAEETGKPVGNDLRAGKRTAILAEAEGRLSAAGRAAIRSRVRARGGDRGRGAGGDGGARSVRRARGGGRKARAALRRGRGARQGAAADGHGAGAARGRGGRAGAGRRGRHDGGAGGAAGPGLTEDGVKGTGRASGKVILLGEHAVVYGAPAIAVGIERGARAEATLLPAGGKSRIAISGKVVYADAESPGKLGRALAALLAAGSALPPVRIEATSELTPGGGLGSSAAIGVAVARAAMAAAGIEADDEAARARADAWERVFHGNPSGIDTAAAAIGDLFQFTRAGGPEPLASAREIVLCVGMGDPAPTDVMVGGLAKLRESNPDRVDREVQGITALVQNARLAIEAGDLVGLGRLMDLNQMILAGLMLSTEQIEDLCRLARGAGALGAKLTGKGGGGAVIALVEGAEGAEPVLAAWRAAGYEGFSIKISTRTS
ncbi:MAG: mevalonate kinase [Minicystis sp.]